MSRSMSLIFDTSREYPRIHVWCKFGDYSLNLWQGILQTSQSFLSIGFLQIPSWIFRSNTHNVQPRKGSWTCLLSMSHFCQASIWTITHCLGLCHETMVCAVCISIFLFLYKGHLLRNILWSKGVYEVTQGKSTDTIERFVITILTTVM